MTVHVRNRPHALESIATDNERSLDKLARALVLSKDQFALILVRCNYGFLRTRILRELKMVAAIPIREFVLPPSTPALHTAIQTAIGDEYPLALTILGLESIAALDDLFASTNRERDQFPISFQFPIVLWVTDEVLHQLIRFAPDFKNWAAPAIKFGIATDTLIDFLRQSADYLFAAVLAADGGKFLYNADLNLALGCRHRLELEAAVRDITQEKKSLDPALQASVKFVLGRDDYANDQIESALTCYQESLEFWKQAAKNDRGAAFSNGARENRRNGNGKLPLSRGNFSEEKNRKHFLALLPCSAALPQSQAPSLLERQGVLLYHIGLCYRRLAERQLSENRCYWQQTRQYFQQCIVVFEQAERPDLVARFISSLGEALQHLEVWDELQSVAERSQDLHQIYGSQIQLAQDWGFLASVALARSQWDAANSFAQQSLDMLASQVNVPCQHRSQYHLLLARSQQHRGQLDAAIHHLEQARSDSDPSCDPQLYIQILNSLRTLYFKQGRYRQAFRIKQDLCAVEYQYGYRTFIGAAPLQPQHHVAPPAPGAALQTTVAPEIAVSGRQHDLQQLIERIGRADRALTVIHGNSGVGKSSTIRAGLVPILQKQAIGDRLAIPVVVQNYNRWQQTLAEAFSDSLQVAKTAGILPVLDSMDAIVAQFKENADCNRLTVLIFEQFETFFFTHTTQAARLPFYQFLNTCLNLPFVKVILSLREDYLHYLLEFERLMQPAAINSNILDKDIRYHLGNFSPADAERAIQTLTNASKFQLEPALIQQLVQDLQGEEGDIQPIELQIVGIQLQANGITTLTQYQQQGAKEKLVEQFLERAIQDCGPENEATARQVLYALTDETGIRPLKTRAELAAETGADLEVLDLVLEILVGGGFVFLVPEVPADRYQLVRDYLVSLIRQR